MVLLVRIDPWASSTARLTMFSEAISSIWSFWRAASGGDRRGHFRVRVGQWRREITRVRFNHAGGPCKQTVAGQRHERAQIPMMLIAGPLPACQRVGDRIEDQRKDHPGPRRHVDRRAMHQRVPGAALNAPSDPETIGPAVSCVCSWLPRVFRRGRNQTICPGAHPPWP